MGRSTPKLETVSGPYNYIQFIWGTNPCTSLRDIADRTK